MKAVDYSTINTGKRRTELEAVISELTQKLEKDYALLLAETAKRGSVYNPEISGARHRILVNESLLARYKNELSRI